MHAEKLVDIITRNVNSIVVVINREGELIYISKSVERILGYSQEELLRNDWWKTTSVTVETEIGLLDYFKKLVKEKEFDTASTERLIFDSCQKKKWILWNSSLDEEGNIVSVGYDITNRKKAENKIKKSNNLLRLKNKEILDSLNYAQSIQHAILPKSTFHEKYFSNGFIINSPKDIVSGDFYWFHERDDLLYVACVDCTGHGVPGALMTILSYNLLQNVVKHQKIVDPAAILHAVDFLLYEEFNHHAFIKRADGMDISLCVFDFEKQQVAFSAALHSILVKEKSSGLLTEYKGKRYPIGLYHDVEKKFETTHIPFHKGDVFYLFSDGIVDQFGGEFNKKFTKKRFKALLQSQEILLKNTEQTIVKEFVSWLGKNDQTDDVLILGLEI